MNTTTITSGNRRSWLAQERDEKVHQQNLWKHQDSASSKVCPPRTCSYPKEEFTHQISHRTLMNTLNARDDVHFIGEQGRISKKKTTTIIIIIIIITQKLSKYKKNK